MTHPPDQGRPQPRSHRTVLDSVADMTGEAPKVLLPDEDSAHGASPVLAPGAANLVPDRGGYQIMGEIARGGMGLILKGHDTDLGRDVAMKVLDGELAKQPAIVKRFVEEAQIGGQLQHPGIVPVYELGLMADERPYFTMKLVKGRTLSALLQQRKSPIDNRRRILSIFESVCQTVAYAHSKGVLHRDLKPANIMVGAFGEVQVVDWGLAKVLSRGGVADEKRAKQSMMTVIETVRSGPGSSGSDSLVGSVMGTPAYMAPEQAQGEIEKLDERADVFSLGAILCEILTGKPPYEDAEGERTVVQAARARLDPARERIEACRADEVLTQLCLDCLMPARDARPNNADEVAQVIQEYLASMEQRAHNAEVAAAKAQVKAKAERRARILTLALGSTVVLALVLGGGGFFMLQKERQQRVEQTRVAVEEAQGESIALGQAGRPAEALEAARRAFAMVDSGAADAALRERSARFVKQAEEAQAAAELERELAAKDEQLRATLEALRLDQAATIGNEARAAGLEESFKAAFLEYGVDLEAEDLVPAMKHIRDRDIAEEVALALDDWSRLRSFRQGRDSEETHDLIFLALDLDPDPVRRRLREAILANDLATMLQLAEPERLHELPPGSIWVLGSILWGRFPGERPVVFRMYDQALRLYPDDFILQAIGGRIYQGAGRREASLACYGAALSLRPDNADIRVGMAESLFFSGHLTEALGSAMAAVTLDPTDSTAHYNLGISRFHLGDYKGAIDALSKSLALEDIDNRRADWLVARFYAGEVTADEIIQAMDRANEPMTIATYAWSLIDHPDPAQRRAELGLEAVREPAVRAQNDFRVIETVALIELGEWEEASGRVSRRYAPETFLVLSPGAHEFMRAVIYAGLGRDELAIECHARGLAQWDQLSGGDPDAWSRSDVIRWRTRAEAAMAR